MERSSHFGVRRGAGYASAHSPCASLSSPRSRAARCGAPDFYFDPANTPRPDVAGWRRERAPERPRGIPIRLRPDWICEILSTNERNDLIKKKRVYHRHQVPNYWIIDPEEETLTVHRWAAEGYLEILVAERADRVRAEPFDAIPLAVGVLFGDDDDDGQPLT